MTYPITGRQQLDANRRTLLTGVSSSDNTTLLPVEIDPTTGAINVLAVSGTAALPTTLGYNQVTITGTATQLTTKALKVGVIVQAMSTNTASIYIGDSTVTASIGFELQPGQATSVAISNVNKLWAITAGTTQALCFIGS